MKISKDVWIIGGFALAHALVALCCRLASLSDEVMLTLLTMLMVVILSLRWQVGVSFMAIAVAAVNILGYLLGRWTADLLWHVFSSPLAVYPVSTFVCTLIMGGGTLAAAIRYNRLHPSGRGSSSERSLVWLLTAFAIIIAVRLAIVLGSAGGFGGQGITILLNYIFTLAVVVVIAISALRYQDRARSAAEDANLARWRYVRLKHQVDPHFLFNSLNVLDCLIAEQSREEASAYTHKLADIYRYMLRNEDALTVSLRDEMEFVGKYVDLLGVRFPEGLVVETSIPERDMSRRVVPCSVQLLIENATKHNAVRPDDPLHIRIVSDVDRLLVTNDKHPRLSSSRVESMGLGLKYIRQQYNDIASMDIRVRDADDEFEVILPLLEK